MEQRILMEALVQAKRLYNLLDEVRDLSMQMAEALDRGDEIVVQMLLDMRDEPIRKLKLADQALRSQKLSLPKEEGEQLAALLNGTVQPEGAEESMLFNQAASNRRLHQQVMELEQILNQKIARGKSNY